MPETKLPKECHKCKEILGDSKHPLDYFVEVYGVHFHKDCWNPYEHYYGLGRPID